MRFHVEGYLVEIPKRRAKWSKGKPGKHWDRKLNNLSKRAFCKWSVLNMLKHHLGCSTEQKVLRPSAG